MNPIITFPHSVEPSLRLPRVSAEKWAETLAEERRRLQEDHEALREREVNLREYEARLRALQAEIDANRTAPAPRAQALGYSYTPAAASTSTRPTSKTPFHDDAALQTAWDKLHRAREILEAEQNHLRDERIMLREQVAAVKAREQAVSEREAKLAEREALMTEVASMQEVHHEPVAPEHAANTMSAVTKLTLAPFNMARSMFGAKKE
jgi:predicted transcriptional regulator